MHKLLKKAMIDAMEEIQNICNDMNNCYGCPLNDDYGDTPCRYLSHTPSSWELDKLKERAGIADE